MSHVERLALEGLDLRGLRPAPAQSYGAVRLVPLLRDELRQDLRLARRCYRDALNVVQLDGRPQTDFTAYWSYVPHGLVATWTRDGSPAAVIGTHLGKGDGRTLDLGPFTVRLSHRMVKREEGNQLRFLPLHVAMEGFLSICFGGPTVAWKDYSRQVLSRGLSPRTETARGGSEIEGLDEALRTFEMHEAQVGMAVFVSDALAAVFVVSHPDDYRDMHRSLLRDFYGELLYQYALCHPAVGVLSSRIGAGTTVDELRREVRRVRDDLAQFSLLMLDGLLSRPLDAKFVYRAGPFEMVRFSSDLEPGRENHIGEAILAADGTVQYLKTFRLSAAQVRRAFLLQQLSLAEWNVDAAAARLSTSREDLVGRVAKAGFEYFFKPDVLAASRSKK